MTARDYYDALGVDRDASQDEIRKAYRKSALQFHPDRNPGDSQAEERFKEAAEAYEVLGNEETRRRYDRYGEAGLKGMPLHDFRSPDDIFSVFSDFFAGAGIFDDLFGARRGMRSDRGRSLRVRVDVSLEEVLGGAEKEIALMRADPCEACGGKGAAEDGLLTCASCRGYGQVESRQGFFRVRTSCPRCGGSGTIISKPCPACDGHGRVQKEVSVTVRVPPGIESGTRLRMAGQGERSPGGPPGDLYCDVYVAAHPVFERAGADLLCALPIGYPTAALGGEVDVPTLDGEVRSLAIARGTQSGEVLRLRRMGLPHMGTGGRGDLLVRVEVETPTRLTPRQEELLRELAAIEHVHVSEKRQSFLDKLKEYLSGTGKADGRGADND
jgi:molecular chaperone DnaJ